MQTFKSVLRQRVRTVDLVLLSALPTVLLGIFVLPLSIRKEFLLSFRNPTLIDAYVSNFVHLTINHLLVNLLTYFILVPTVYLCFLFADERRRFLTSYIYFVTILPFLLSLMSAFSTKPLFGFGFSGINMAFFGLLPVGLVVYYREHFASGLDLDHAIILFFSGALTITALAAPIQQNVIVAVGLAVSGTGIYGQDLLEKVSEISIEGIYRMYTEDPVGYGELATAGAIIFICLPLVMFPPQRMSESGLLNYYIHFLGYCFGFISSFGTFRLLSSVNERLVRSQ